MAEQAYLKIVDYGARVKLFTNLDADAIPEMLYLAKVAEMIIMREGEGKIKCEGDGTNRLRKFLNDAEGDGHGI